MDVLAKLATIKDRTFKSRDEWDKWLDESQIDVNIRKRVTDASSHPINTKDGSLSGGYPSGKLAPDTLGEDAVYCLNAADGKIVWKHVGWRGSHTLWVGSCTPCVANGRVYVLRNDGWTYCLNAQDGTEIWTVRHNTTSHGGNDGHSSLVVVDGLAIVQDGPLVALDATTGAVVWKQEAQPTGDNTPAPWVKNGKTYLICNSQPKMTASCVDARTGNILWTVPGGYWCSPAVSGDVMVTYTGKKLLCYRMGLDKAELLWEAKCHCDHYNSACPLIHGNRVYQTEQGRISCFNLEDGMVIWEGKTASDDWGSPVWVDEKLVITTGNSLSLLNAASDKFELLAQVNMPGLVEYPIPAIANGRLYLRFRDGIRCYDVTHAMPSINGK